MLTWLSLSNAYADSTTAGTELFVHRVNRRLVDRGHRVVGAHYGEVRASALDGVELLGMDGRFGPRSRIDDIAARPLGLDGFRSALERVRPDVVHVNAFGATASVEHVEAARAAGARVVVTYHSPGFSCQQTALTENGLTACDGRLDVQRCTRCCLRWLGLAAPAAEAFSRFDGASVAKLVPAQLRHPFERLRGSSEFIDRWHRFMSGCDVVTYASEWISQLLTVNAVPAERMMPLPLPPPDYADPPPDDFAWRDAPPGSKRVLFMGRIHATKGVDVLLDAVCGHLRGEKLYLAMLGAEGPQPYVGNVERRIAADGRVKLFRGCTPSQVFAALRGADAALVPSLWMETGPYAVLESQWVGAPVIGSDLGGIPERLRGYGAQQLFPAGDASALAACIRRVVPGQRGEFDRAGYIRTFDVALDRLLTRVSPARTQQPT